MIDVLFNFAMAIDETFQASLDDVVSVFLNGCVFIIGNIVGGELKNNKSYSYSSLF